MRGSRSPAVRQGHGDTRKSSVIKAFRILQAFTTRGSALTVAVELDIREQARATIENVREILRSVGGTLSDVVELDAFLVSMDDYKGFNEVYARYFDAGGGPARCRIRTSS